jgi:hypothetical protein
MKSVPTISTKTIIPCTAHPEIGQHTALSSAKFPHLAKCALRLALELPPATPHNARNTPAALRIDTRITPAGTMGDRQSRIMAKSLKTSAARR